MGRFYKTAKPEFTDFMYQIPEQAILSAIKGADAQLAKDEGSLTDFQKQLQQKALSPDVDEQRQILKDYEEQIKQHALKINTNPLEALKQRQGIRELGNTIYEDVTRGKLAAQYANYAARQKHYEEELKRVSNKEITQEDLNASMAAWDAQYAAEKRDVEGNLVEKAGVNYDPLTGRYRTYGAQKLVNFYDTAGKAKEFSEGWEPDVDKSVEIEKIAGDFYVTDKTSNKTLTINSLTKGLYSMLATDPKLRAYYDQKINILSGGNAAEKERLQKIFYGSREDPNNPLSPLKLVPVKDKQGNDVFEQRKDAKGNIVKVPLMQAESVGEIYTIARAAADRKDINKTDYSHTIGGMTEKAESDLRLAENLAKKRQESTLLDTNHNEVQESVFGGSSIREIETNLQNSKASVNTILENAAISYGDIIKKLPGYNATQKTAMVNKVAELTKGKRWNELQTYITENNLAGIEGIGTGVKNLSKQIKSIDTQNSNDERLLNDLKRRVQKNLIVNGMYFDDAYAEAQSRLNSVRNSGQPRLIAEAENALRQLRLQLGTAINQELKTSGTNTKSIQISSGNNMKGIVPEPVIDNINNVLNNVGKNFLGMIPSGTGAVLVTKGRSEATNVNELINQNKFSLKDIFGSDFNVKYGIFDNKATKLLNIGIAQSNVNVPIGGGKYKNIGKDALAITILHADPGTGKQVESTIYVPKSEFNNTDYDQAIKLMNPYTTAKNFADDARTKLEHEAKKGGNASNLYYESEEGVNFYPYAMGVGGVQGKWEFPNGKIMYGREGEQYYSNLLQAEN
jgi:hypothetical protein